MTVHVLHVQGAVVLGTSCARSRAAADIFVKRRDAVVPRRMVLAILLLVGAAASSTSADATSLVPPTLQRLPAGAILPKGWLQDQVRFCGVEVLAIRILCTGICALP